MRLYINPRNTDQGGQTELFFKIKHGGKWRAIMTGIKVLPDAWDQKGQQILKGRKQYNVDEKNKALVALRHKLEGIAYRNTEYSIQEIKRLFYGPEDTPNDIPGLLDMFEYIENKYASKYAHNYIRTCKQVAAKLKAFKPQIQYHDINQAFYDDYLDYMLSNDYSNATIKKHFKFIRKACREAERMGQTISTEYKDFTFTEERPQPVWLTWDEVKAIEGLKLTGTEQRIRDVFIFRCYTGLRHSDLQNISRVENDVLIFDSYKTKKNLSIKLNPTALQIIGSYGGVLPVYVQQYENVVIKQICEQAGITEDITFIEKYSGQKRVTVTKPKNKLIASHTARRTFAKHWMEKGGDIVKLSKYLGHSSVTVTQKYLGYTDDEIGSEMLRLFG